MEKIWITNDAYIELYPPDEDTPDSWSYNVFRFSFVSEGSPVFEWWDYVYEDMPTRGDALKHADYSVGGD